jgi:dihydroorotate dehydrogenase
MIKLSNNHVLNYVVASGAFGYFGKGWFYDWPFMVTGQIKPSLFTVVAKTVTYEKRKGNLRWYWPFGCIRFIKGGTLNAVGLTNPGYKWWAKKYKQGREKRISLIASIFSNTPNAVNELVRMAYCLDAIYDIVAIEINASCPNTEGDILKNTKRIIESCERVKKATHYPLLLKLSVVHKIDEILPNITGIIEAISINSVPWRIVFPNQKSPLERFGGGGVSGRAAQPYTFPFVKQLTEKTDIPVIGCGVWEYQDIERLRKLGAKAISFGSIFLRYPWRPTSFVKKDMSRW